MNASLKPLDTRNTSGFSLVEIMIALCVMMIGFLAFTSAMMRQQQETKALSEKMTALDLQNFLGKVLADGTVCKYELVDLGPKTFNSNAIGTTTPPVVSIAQIHASANASAPIVVQTNGVLSAHSSTLRVSTISISNISGTPGGDEYTAQFQIDFDPASSVRPLKPVVFQTMLITDPASPANAKRIVGCVRDGDETAASSCAAGAGNDDLSRPTIACATPSTYRACMCSADWPNCNCNSGNFSSEGSYVSCADAGAFGSTLSRPVVACSNGIDMLSCLCSADWNPACKCSNTPNAFNNSPVSCAAAGGSGSGLSRPVLVCASQSQVRACLCSADWGTPCSCTTLSFTQAGNTRPSCAAGQGAGTGLGRPALTCSNGKSMVTCHCSADWNPKCRCSSANL